MFFTLDNYKVSFKTGVCHVAFVYGVRVLIKDITTCEIHDGEGNTYRGASVRSPYDKNCASKGRKEALKRTLEKFFDEKDRARFWQAYFKAGGKK